MMSVCHISTHVATVTADAAVAIDTTAAPNIAPMDPKTSPLLPATLATPQAHAQAQPNPLSQPSCPSRLQRTQLGGAIPYEQSIDGGSYS